MASFFCRKVYDFFEQVKTETDGVARLRLRSKMPEKRLVEELIPLAKYVQFRYREGRRIKVKWLAGSQSYDAVLQSSGELVKHGLYRKENFVEITTAVHEDDHLARRQLQDQG